MCKEWFLVILLIPTFLFLIFTRIPSYFQKLFLNDWNQLSDGLESKHLGLVFSVKGRGVICPRSCNTLRPLKLMSEKALVPFSFPALQSSTQLHRTKDENILNPIFKNCLI